MLRPLVLFPLLLGIIVIVTATAFQLLNNQTMSKKDIHSQLSDMESFGRETTLLLNQYNEKKINQTYFLQQLQQLDTKMLGIIQTIQDTPVSNSDLASLHQASTIAVNYLMLSKRIENGVTPQDLSDNQKLTKQIINLEKHYE